MMASQPEILLLDEPLSALDSFLKWQVEEELQDLLSRSEDRYCSYPIAG